MAALNIFGYGASRTLETTPPSDQLRERFGYTINRSLGSGSWGDVYSVTVGGREMAMKVCTMDPQEPLPALTGLSNLMEMDAMRDLDHPNIIPILGFVHDESELFNIAILTPVLDMVLGNWLYSCGREEDTIVDVTRSIISGLAYMHSRGRLHLDLAMDNIMMKGNTPIIMDLGFCCKRDMRSSKLYGGVHVRTGFENAEKAILGSYGGSVNAGALTDLHSLSVLIIRLFNPRSRLSKVFCDEPGWEERLYDSLKAVKCLDILHPLLVKMIRGEYVDCGVLSDQSPLMGGMGTCHLSPSVGDCPPSSPLVEDHCDYLLSPPSTPVKDGKSSMITPEKRSHRLTNLSGTYLFDGGVGKRKPPRWDADFLLRLALTDFYNYPAVVLFTAVEIFYKTTHLTDSKLLLSFTCLVMAAKVHILNTCGMFEDHQATIAINSKMFRQLEARIVCELGGLFYTGYGRLIYERCETLDDFRYFTKSILPCRRRYGKGEITVSECDTEINKDRVIIDEII